MTSFKMKTLWAIIPFKNIELFEQYHESKRLALGVTYLYVINTGAHSTSVTQISNNEFELRTTDQSMYDAWNQGLDALPIDVDYVTFLGDDDYLNPAFIDIILGLNESYHILYGDVRIRKYGITKVARYSTAPVLFSSNKVKFQDVPHPGCVFTMSLFREAKHRYNKAYRLAGDLDLYLSIFDALKNKLRFRHIDEIQAVIGGYGVSRSNDALAIYRREWLQIETDHDVTIRQPLKWRIKQKLTWRR